MEIGNYFIALLLFLGSLTLSYGQCSPDLTAPTITCVGNVSVPCPHKIGYDTGDTAINPTTFDACGAIVLQTYTLTGATNGSSAATGINDASYVSFLAGTTTVTYYIEDTSGNSASCNFNVTVTDNVAPLIICPPNLNTINDVGLCGTTIATSALSYPTVYDSCFGISTVPTGIPAGYFFPVGVTTVTWTATDAAGNSATCLQTVTIEDQENPAILCPVDITVNTTPGLCTANVTMPDAFATDNCAVSSATNDFNSGGINASGIYPIGTTVVTFTVMDATNRTATCSMNVTVTNTQNPTLTLLGTNPMTLEACDVYTELGATASDTCSGDITSDIVIDSSSVLTNTVGSYSVTYTVTNVSGNSTQVIRTVNVVDTTNPTLTLTGPDPLSIGDCSTYTELGAVAIDPCFGDISGNVVIDNSSVDTSTLGAYTVTYSVIDDSGNPGPSITRIVNVVDSTPPDITLLGDNPQIIEACTAYTELGATALDPCFNIDFTSSIVIDASGVNTTIPGFYTVTYNVMDLYGNMSFEIIRDVEVVDTTTPTIMCPADITVNNDTGECSAIVTFTPPIGIDNCPVSTTQTAGLSSGSAFPIGITTNTFEVSDGDGNMASCTFDVIVNDTELPVAICSNLTLQLNPSTGTATILPSDIDNGSSDNCNFILTVSQDTFDCSHLGDNTIILTNTDDSGNMSTCNATVTITDLAENTSISISTPTNPICPGEFAIFTAVATSGSTTPTYQWQINDADVPGETASTFSTNTLNDGDEVTVLLTSNASFCTPIIASNIITMNVIDYNPPADAGVNITNTICTNTTVNLAASAILGGGTTGLWTVTSSQTSGYSFSDDTSPSSTFTGDIGETYTLAWSLDNPNPCPDTSDSIVVTFINCSALDFDGLDDNITFRDNYNFNGDFTIEVWIKSEVSNTNIQTIFSKREANNLIDGYDLRLVDDYISFNWNNGQSLTSPYKTITNQWHQIAVTFDGGTYTLYIDGIEMNSTSGVLPIANSVDCILGAMDQTVSAPFKPLHYFNGGMDELRIWNVALNTTQIRTMMNQEIEDNAGIIRGTSVPMDVTSLLWSDLNAYYQMNQSNDILGGNLISNNSNSIDGLLRYMTTLQSETAPLPYKSEADGLFMSSSTWLHGTVQALPNTMGIDGTTKIDWNIVNTNHNISSGDNNITLLGLNVESNTVSIENSDPTDGQSLTITDYLILDGTLELVGESQLLQTANSMVDYSGNGILKRDQQGTSNLFNYNYWSSPVSTDGSIFNVGSILYDGSQPVLWTTAHDANPATTPVTMSSRWLYLYENYPVNSYADWSSIDETSSITVGLGFLMKGSGAATAEQNYTFIGKPNNGTISTPITANYEALVGNPYPSAIDAHEFINDNSSSMLGTLYFWEQYTTNDTHILADYQGGYSTYNLTGGNPAVSPPEVSGLGSSTKIPERYIPVGQGFTVDANTTGGQITFENDQRVFVKEAVTGAADNGSVFIRQHSQIQRQENDPIKRIRLEFTTPEGAKRPFMIGFVPNNLATDGFDYGYDALNSETFPNDISWMIDNQSYVVQGVGEFDAAKLYPLRIVLETQGTFDIGARALENFEEPINIYVYDAVLDTYASINTEHYVTTLEGGDYLNRFYIAFAQQNTLSNPDAITTNVVLNYLNDTEEIYIKTPFNETIKTVALINMLGQTVQVWDVNNYTNELRLPVTHIAEGNYIIKLQTTSTTVTKKVVVSF